MTPEKQRIAIAEACPTVFAVRRFSTGKTQLVWRFDNDTQGPVPTVDPLCDLNAMHQAEKTLTPEQERNGWRYWLESICGTMGGMLHATASQRAEAFLKTLGKWEETE